MVRLDHLVRLDQNQLGHLHLEVMVHRQGLMEDHPHLEVMVHRQGLMEDHLHLEVMVHRQDLPAGLPGRS